MSCLSRLASIDGGLMEACFFQFYPLVFLCGFSREDKRLNTRQPYPFLIFSNLKISK